MRLPRYVLAFALATAWFLAASGGAEAAGCRAPKNAASFEVQVNVDVSEPEIYNSLSKAQLGTTNVHGQRGQILGTTESGLELRWSIEYQVSEWRNVYCFWVVSSTVQLSYHQLDVNIASDYAPGTCQYKAILDHEFEHVEVAHNVLQPYAQQIRQALTSLSIPTSHVPMVANSPEIAREQVEEAFRRTLFPVRDHMTRVMAERQAHVDTIDNYRRTWRRCRRW